MIRARCLHKPGHLFSISSVDLKSSQRSGHKVPRLTFCPLPRHLTVAHSFTPFLLELLGGMNSLEIRLYDRQSHGDSINRRFNGSTAVSHHDSPRRLQHLHLPLRSSPIMSLLPRLIPQRRENSYQPHSTR